MVDEAIWLLLATPTWREQFEAEFGPVPLEPPGWLTEATRPVLGTRFVLDVAALTPAGLTPDGRSVWVGDRPRPPVSPLELSAAVEPDAAPRVAPEERAGEGATPVAP